MANKIQELENKISLLNSILSASIEFKTDIDLKVVLKKVLDVISNATNAEAGSLWLVDKEKNVIRAEVATGAMAHRILNFELKPNEGVVGRVISNQKSEFVEEVTKDPNWAQRVDQKSGFITRSLMTVPLIAKNNVIGAMQLVNKKANQLFNQQDLNLCEALAIQAALAIQNSQMYDELQRFSRSAMRSLVLALDARDPYTAGHSTRVSEYSIAIARRLGLADSDCNSLEAAALMHDIGKIAVPDQILGKPDRLDDVEFRILKLHPLNATKILSSIEPKKQALVAQQTARYHHEKVNGTGYPDGLRGEEIPFFAKIVAVADAFDAMTTDRPYSKGKTIKEAVEELIRCKGTHFDAQIVDVFAEIMLEKVM